MRSALLLDTCAVIWIAEDQPFAAAAREAVEEAIESGDPVLVSPMTAWEVGMLVARGRMSLAHPPAGWFAAFTANRGVALSPLTPNILVASSFLPGAPPNDPVDRMMLATARDLGCRLVTRDAALLAYGELGHVRTLAC